jgi:hypothetical protein
LVQIGASSIINTKKEEEENSKRPLSERSKTQITYSVQISSVTMQEAITRKKTSA